MGKSVFVTVCNDRDIPSAKQLFAAAATHGCWTGDYCLICRDLKDDDIRWFRNRGVLVMPVEPIIPEDIWASHRRGNPIPQVALLKLYMFSEEFRQWDSVVYMDTDILIRGSIEHLAGIDSFSAVPDNSPRIKDQYLKQKVNGLPLGKKTLRMKAFNAGVLAFPTAAIPTTAFEELKEITKETLKEAFNSDQTFLNVYFAGRWKRLPAEYNALAAIYGRLGTKRDNRILHGARVVHYAGVRKPSVPNNPGNTEWRNNLRTADSAKSFSTLEPSGPEEPLSPARSVDRVQTRLALLGPLLYPCMRLRRFTNNPAKIIKRRLGVLIPILQEAE